MSHSREHLWTWTTPSIAATGAEVGYFQHTQPVRIVKVWAVPEVSEAAHATQVLDVTLTKRLADGSGTTVVAVLTNDSDLADNEDAPVRESGAWVDDVSKTIDFENRPGSPTKAENMAYALAAGERLEVDVAKAAGTQTGAVTVGIEYRVSS